MKKLLLLAAALALPAGALDFGFNGGCDTCAPKVVKPCYTTIKVMEKQLVPVKSYQMVEKEVPCTQYQTVTKQVPVMVKKTFWEDKEVEVKKPVMVDVEYTEKVVTNKIVEEQATRKVCKMVCEQRTCRVPYTVCKPVQYCRTINEMQCVTKKVPYTVSRCVPKVTCVQVPVQVMVPVFGAISAQWNDIPA